MMSPVSGRMASNLVSSLTQRAPLGDAKAAAQPLDAKAEEKLQDPLAELEKMIGMLLEQLKRAGALPPSAAMGGAGGGGGGAAPAAAGRSGGGGGGGGGGGMPAAAAGAPAMAPYSLGGGLDGAGGINGLQVSDPRLAQALQQIASHPEGAALIEAAKANGLASISANPGLNPDGGGGIEGLYRPGSNAIEITNPNSPNLLDTLVHELGHAATKGDGNSQLEERTVDALGKRIMAEITGRQSTFNLDEGAYTALPGNNGILNNLRNLGIRV